MLQGRLTRLAPPAPGMWSPTQSTLVRRRRPAAAAAAAFFPTAAGDQLSCTAQLLRSFSSCVCFCCQLLAAASCCHVLPPAAAHLTALWPPLLRPHPATACAAVPREARLEIDVRDIDGPRRDSVVAAIRAEAAAIAQRRKVRLVFACRRQLSAARQLPPCLPRAAFPQATCACTGSAAWHALCLLRLLQVRHSVDIINQDPPATCGAKVVAAVQASVR
jgi:hypothetical protein